MVAKFYLAAVFLMCFSFLRCCGVFSASVTHDSVGQGPWAKHCHGVTFNTGRNHRGTQLAYPAMDSPAAARDEVPRDL